MPRLLSVLTLATFGLLATSLAGCSAATGEDAGDDDAAEGAIVDGARLVSKLPNGFYRASHENRNFYLNVTSSGTRQAIDIVAIAKKDDALPVDAPQTDRDLLAWTGFVDAPAYGGGPILVKADRWAAWSFHELGLHPRSVGSDICTFKITEAPQGGGFDLTGCPYKDESALGHDHVADSGAIMRLTKVARPLPVTADRNYDDVTQSGHEANVSGLYIRSVDDEGFNFELALFGNNPLGWNTKAKAKYVQGGRSAYYSGESVMTGQKCDILFEVGLDQSFRTSTISGTGCGGDGAYRTRTR